MALRQGFALVAWVARLLGGLCWLALVIGFYLLVALLALELLGG